MKINLNSGNELLLAILDAMPSNIFAVDQDVCILAYNTSAKALVDPKQTELISHRCGDVLKCLRASETPQGCGGAAECRECVVRQSVQMAYEGNRVVRRRAKLDIVRDGKASPFFALITTAPLSHEGNRLVLLIVEDFNQIVDLQRLIPICAKCGKVRADSEYWVRMERFFKDHLDVDFSHAYCPDCFNAEIERIRQR